MNLWFLIVSLIMLVFLLRASFLLFGTKLELSEGFDRVFRFVPAAILAALVGPAFVKNEGVIDYSFTNPFLLAGLVSVLVAGRTKSIPITLITGMLCLWLFKWFLS